jgi:hypothetical protein
MELFIHGIFQDFMAFSSDLEGFKWIWLHFGYTEFHGVYHSYMDISSYGSRGAFSSMIYLIKDAIFHGHANLLQCNHQKPGITMVMLGISQWNIKEYVRIEYIMWRNYNDYMDLDNL